MVISFINFTKIETDRRGGLVATLDSCIDGEAGVEKLSVAATLMFVGQKFMNLLIYEVIRCSALLFLAVMIGLVVMEQCIATTCLLEIGLPSMINCVGVIGISGT